MASPQQQFSLKWNNYSQHIVTALEELRVDDELTDVTLSCDGQRIKAHKLLLSACSVFFKETFKENPCKHPVIILKGVSFQDLQAVVQFMYNGQVNVTQERLPSFLQTAEILHIKGLTDSASEKEESTPHTQTILKKRPQTFPSQASTLTDSVRQDGDSRPPTPKRKRVAAGAAHHAQNSELPGTGGTPSVISVGGGGNSSSSQSKSSQSTTTNNPPPPLLAHNSDNSTDGLPMVKFEEQDGDEDYERQEENDNSFQDNGKDSNESNSLGHLAARSASGYGDSRGSRYIFQPASHDLSSATGVVDAATAAIWARTTGLLGIQAGAYDDQDEVELIDASAYQTMMMMNNSTSGLDSGGEDNAKTTQGYVCPICGHVSRSAGGRSNHMQTHRDPKICPICNQTFLRRDNLNRHIREKHQGQRRRP